MSLSIRLALLALAAGPLAAATVYQRHAVVDPGGVVVRPAEARVDRWGRTHVTGPVVVAREPSVTVHTPRESTTYTVHGSHTRHHSRGPIVVHRPCWPRSSFRHGYRHGYGHGYEDGYDHARRVVRVRPSLFLGFHGPQASVGLRFGR